MITYLYIRLRNGFLEKIFKSGENLTYFFRFCNISYGNGNSELFYL